MTKAKNSSTVTIHFTGRFDNGEVFISSRNSRPAQFVIGRGQIMKALEDAVVGMIPGESKKVKVPAARAFGERLANRVATIDRANFPRDVVPRQGQKLKVSRPEGGEMTVAITEVTDTTVTVDANHPHAGKDISLDIQLLKVD